MRWHPIRVLPALLILAPAAVAVTPATLMLELQPASRLWISGTSTVRSFECTATAFEVNVDAAPNAVPALLAGEKVVRAVELQIPTERLDCKNGTMNEHMLKALKAKANPTIDFRLASYDLAKAGDGIRVTLDGTLTIGGVEKPISLIATAEEDSSGALHVVGSHEVRMTQWGLKPPSLMLGTMKVDERIKVQFDLLLK